MPLFYTRKGDAGTSQVGNTTVPKDSPVLITLGDLDEVNSLLGVVRSSIEDTELQEKIKRIQEVLFIIQARVAWIMFPEHPAKELAKDHIERVEHEIDAIEERIQPERGFIIPGEHPIAAQLDYARAVARRVERRINSLHKIHELPPEILMYMNRLSSYLYALARLEAFNAQAKESKPTYE